MKGDPSISFIIGKIGVNDGLKMCWETNKKQ